MSEPYKLTRIPTLKSVEEFSAHVTSLRINLPCEKAILPRAESPLARPIELVQIGGKKIGNRIAIQPMEGWDGTVDGRITENVVRRWRRFGESGAKLIYGGEAMAICPEGRANPNQLIIGEQNLSEFRQLREALVASHLERFGETSDLVIGFQLTHSGRFCRPNDKRRWESRVAYRHPLLDQKFGGISDEQIVTDEQVSGLIKQYVAAARVAARAGADFVDIKHCHGYLLHEFLSAFTRPGPYGGSFENRTRILREIVAGIRADGNPIDLGVRLSAFDLVPFRPDATRAQRGRLGPGIPEDFSGCLPYRYAFGVNENDPIEYDLGEPFRFMELCGELGIKLLNLSAGSPYYNPHLQRPAAYPPSDGYQPAHDPLIDVARQIDVVRQFKERAPRGLILVGSAYSYLQEYLPHVAQHVVRHGWSDMIGMGRMTLSYPGLFADAWSTGTLSPRLICRTFSDCTTAPRNGLISGCYPLDRYYADKPEARELKEIKKKMAST